MKKLIIPFLCCFVLIAFQNCSKKVHPGAAPAEVRKVKSGDTTQVLTKIDTMALEKMDSIAKAKPPVRKKHKEPAPQVIVVNDKFAKKSVDGRYYYDLQGHRYWRNNKDGKYYLFNKTMLSNEDFKSKE